MTQAPAIAHLTPRSEGIVTENESWSAAVGRALLAKSGKLMRGEPMRVLVAVSTMETFATPACGARISNLNGTTCPAVNFWTLAAGLSANWYPLHSQTLHFAALKSDCPRATWLMPWILPPSSAFWL